MNNHKGMELKVLKAVLWVYICLCFIIAGLNYGYASRATEATAKSITWFWHFYENWIKTVFIVLCSVLTIRIVGTSKISTMRKRNLCGFIISALVVHVLGPVLLKNSELYFFTMPLPWTTTPLQLLETTSGFYQSRFPVWGLTGVTMALIFYGSVSVIVIVGTLLFGRRWQCSTLCLFNGFASEVFAPAFPLVGKKSEVKPGTHKFLSKLRWIFLSISLFFTLYWIMHLCGISLPIDIQMMGKIENYKYLVGELLMAMFFWIAFVGRGYCYYCPLGTVLGFVGKLSGQKITTDNTKCVQCNQCNVTCPMSIDIRKKAQSGEAVKELRCVGCGHCVDVCPTKTLSYSTKYLSRKKREQKIDNNISI